MWRKMFTKNAVEHRHTIVNGEYLPRFQKTAEQYGFIPTYFVDYEMSYSGALVTMAKTAGKKLEIGMHMHAWSCPPWYELPGRNENPYITEYPREVVHLKVRTLTERLRNVFRCDITSTRSGRWGFNRDYVDALFDCDYLADCSVTPGMDWRENIGQTDCEGPDYRNNPSEPYLLKGDKDKKLIEIPVTVKSENKSVVWLRPNGSNLQEMKCLVDQYRDHEYLEFMIHSTELMPWGSPNFRSTYSIEKLYMDIHALFAYLQERGYRGCSVSAYAERLRKRL